MIGASFVLLAGHARGADDPESAPPPEVRPGDSWTYRRFDHLKNVEFNNFRSTVTHVGPDVILLFNTNPKSASNAKEEDANWTREWNARTLSRGFVYRPHTSLLRFPLKVGNEYDAVYELAAVRGGKTQIKYALKVKVVGWEDVVVPAGKFRALKIESRGTFQRLDKLESGWVRRVIWYVPEVERFVKISYEHGADKPDYGETSELLEYSLNP